MRTSPPRPRPASPLRTSRTASVPARLARSGPLLRSPVLVAGDLRLRVVAHRPRLGLRLPGRHVLQDARVGDREPVDALGGLALRVAGEVPPAGGARRGAG